MDIDTQDKIKQLERTLKQVYDGTWTPPPKDPSFAQGMYIDRCEVQTALFIPGSTVEMNELIITAKDVTFGKPREIVKLHYTGMAASKLVHILYKGRILCISGLLHPSNDEYTYIDVKMTCIVGPSNIDIAAQIRLNIQNLEKQGRLPINSEKNLYGWPGQHKSIESFVNGEPTLPYE